MFLSMRAHVKDPLLLGVFSMSILNSRWIKLVEVRLVGESSPFVDPVCWCFLGGVILSTLTPDSSDPSSVMFNVSSSRPSLALSSMSMHPNSLLLSVAPGSLTMAARLLVD